MGHPSAQAIAEDISLLDVAPAQDAPSASSASSLSREEVEFFKSNGYLIKRGLLSDCRPSFEQALDYFWDKVPRHSLSRDDSDGWLDNPGSHWREEDHARVGSLLGTNWKMRSPGESGIGTEPFLVEDIAQHPKMLEVVSTFLGSSIKPVRRVRGIYGVFPLSPDKEDGLHPHGDYMAAQCSAMVLIHDLPGRCGGFTVWPGSHQKMHMCWDRVSGSTISGDRISRFARVRDQVLRDTQPVEFSGKVGDVIFWHPRMIHSVGVNYSAIDSKPLVRVIVPIDYQRAGETYVDDLEFGPGPRYQWWLDTRNVLEDVVATPSNLWHGWGIS